MANHKDLISLKQVKNTMKIDRTFSSFRISSSTTSSVLNIPIYEYFDFKVWSTSKFWKKTL